MSLSAIKKYMLRSREGSNMRLSSITFMSLAIK